MIRTSGSLSIVIEWENVKHSKQTRAEAMLEVLFCQLKSLKYRFSEGAEIILVCDASATPASSVLRKMEAEFVQTGNSIRTFCIDGLDYYQQKNFGADQTHSDLLLFLDSDVVPQEGWLEALLDCQAEENADVVCGATYIEANSLYSKSVALFWFFPLPSESKLRSHVSHFYANNVLFKGEVFRGMPYPRTGLVRGECTRLARMLLDCQRSIVLEPKARVIHPAPNGLSHFVKRALCQGHDNVHCQDNDNFWHATHLYFRRLAAQAKRIVSKREEVQLGRIGSLAAIAIATTYNTLEYIGEVLTLAMSPRYPHFIRDKVRV